MAGMGDVGRIINDAISDMPDKIASVGEGFKDLFSGFHDTVRRT